ncbi:hypothetical protein MRX96_044256 [Rhipicephalus microplus]
MALEIGNAVHVLGIICMRATAEKEHARLASASRHSSVLFPELSHFFFFFVVMATALPRPPRAFARAAFNRLFFVLGVAPSQPRGLAEMDGPSRPPLTAPGK